MTKLILAASVALLIAGPALAESARAAEDAPTQTVSTKGVDFANRAEVKHFYAKLRGAAQAVCDSGSTVARVSATDAACQRQVMAEAVKGVNKPVLTALYNAQGDSSRAFAGNDQ